MKKRKINRKIAQSNTRKALDSVNKDVLNMPGMTREYCKSRALESQYSGNLEAALSYTLLALDDSLWTQ